MLILAALKIDAKKIKTNNTTLSEILDKNIKAELHSKVNLSDEEKLNDFIHDKDDVNFREYIPSRE
jgi:hypothetical protein